MQRNIVRKCSVLNKPLVRSDHSLVRCELIENNDKNGKNANDYEIML